MDWETAASEDPWSLPLGSPLADNGRVARTISILSASLSLMGSWGVAKGLVALGATPLVISASFLVTPGCLTSFGGLLEEGGTLYRLFFPGSTTLEGVSALELMEEEARLVRGSIHSLPS